MRPVPFEHGELGRMQGGALAIAIDAGEIEYAALTRRQQLLAGEFGRGVEIKLDPAAVGLHDIGGNGMKMRLITGRDLQRTAFDFGELALFEPCPDRRLDAIARQEKRPAIGVSFGAPPGRGLLRQEGTVAGLANSVGAANTPPEAAIQERARMWSRSLQADCARATSSNMATASSTSCSRPKAS